MSERSKELVLKTNMNYHAWVRILPHPNQTLAGKWLNTVEQLLWEQEVIGSNPIFPIETIQQKTLTG